MVSQFRKDGYYHKLCAEIPLHLKVSYCHGLCFNNLVFRFFVMFSGSYVFRFPVMFFPLSLSLTQVTCFYSQLHVITNHLPTVFSFQIQSQSLRIPHSLFYATDLSCQVRFCHHSLVIQSHSLVLFIP